MASTLSNLLPPPEGKRRTAPIAIDYLRRPSRFDAWKGPLALGAALLTIAAVVLVSLPAGGQRIHSRGPLAQVHASLNNDCQSCHVDFVPISGTAAGLAIDTWAHASDANCQACHTGDIHHNNQLLDADRDIQSANCATATSSIAARKRVSFMWRTGIARSVIPISRLIEPDHRISPNRWQTPSIHSVPNRIRLFDPSEKIPAGSSSTTPCT